MTDTTKNLLIFGLGIIWAMKSSKKAYAPNITTFTTKKELEPQSIEDCPVLPSKPQSQSDCPSGTRFIDTSKKRYIGPPPPSYCEDRGVCGCYRMNNYFNKQSCLNRINSCYTKKNCPPGSSCVDCTGVSGAGPLPRRWCCRTPEEIIAERERSKYDYLIPSIGR